MPDLDQAENEQRRVDPPSPRARERPVDREPLAVTGDLQVAGMQVMVDQCARLPNTRIGAGTISLPGGAQITQFRSPRFSSDGRTCTSPYHLSTA
jgi:hypothetical protein